MIDTASNLGLFRSQKSLQEQRSTDGTLQVEPKVMDAYGCLWFHRFTIDLYSFKQIYIDVYRSIMIYIWIYCFPTPAYTLLGNMMSQWSWKFRVFGPSILGRQILWGGEGAGQGAMWWHDWAGLNSWFGYVMVCLKMDQPGVYHGIPTSWRDVMWYFINIWYMYYLSRTTCFFLTSYSTRRSQAI